MYYKPEPARAKLPQRRILQGCLGLVLAIPVVAQAPTQEAHAEPAQKTNRFFMNDYTRAVIAAATPIRNERVGLLLLLAKSFQVRQGLF